MGHVPNGTCLKWDMPPETVIALTIIDYVSLSHYKQGCLKWYSVTFFCWSQYFVK